jgi:hypothetical protein
MMETYSSGKAHTHSHTEAGEEGQRSKESWAKVFVGCRVLSKHASCGEF